MKYRIFYDTVRQLRCAKFGNLRPEVGKDILQQAFLC
jgi:hypothetical protein